LLSQELSLKPADGNSVCISKFFDKFLFFQADSTIVYIVINRQAIPFAKCGHPNKNAPYHG
jgi:hypothetical protein